MDSETLGKLSRLGLRMVQLTEYGISSDYGYGYERLVEMSGEIKSDIGNALPDIPDTNHVDAQAVPDMGKLEHWQKRVEGMIEEVRKDSRYMNAIRAYDRGDQEALAELMPIVFDGVLLERRGRTLYHGIEPFDVSAAIPTVSGYDNPQHYAERAERIRSEGIKASFGLHQATDENLRPVFFGWKPGLAKGVLCLVTSPSKHDYTVFHKGTWKHKEHLVYAPMLSTPMELGLKTSESLLNEDGPHSVGMEEKNDLLKYRKAVKNALKESGIPFTEIG